MLPTRRDASALASPDGPLLTPMQRFRAALSVWRLHSPMFAEVIANGLIPPWTSCPPPLIDRGDSVKLCGSQAAVACLLAEIRKLLRVGAVIPVTTAEQLCLTSVVSTIFGVPKRDSEAVRLVIDLTTINPFVVYRHFKMEGLRTVRDLLQPGDWMCTVDLADAFHHVPLHRDARRFFRFRFQGTVYEWQAMPFGYSDAPRLFTEIMKVVAQAARARGLRVVFYLDDILLMSISQAQAVSDRDVLLLLLKEFGLSINVKKSGLIPLQLQGYLGVLIDSVRMTFVLPPAKLTALKSLAAQLHGKAAAGGRLGVRTLQRLVGRLQSVADCVLPTRIHLNALIEALRSAEAYGSALLGPVAVADLLWWSDHVSHFNGRSVRTPLPDHLFDSDASEVAWGASYFGRIRADSTESGPIRPNQGRIHCQGFFSSSLTSNHRELTAVFRGLQSLVNLLSWQDCSVRVRTDNLTTMAYVNRMGGRTPHLSRLAEELHRFCLARRILLTAEYLPGVENVIADHLSRIQADWSESQLNPILFRAIDRRFGPHSLDLMASLTNTQLRRYVSYRADPRCLYTDCFSRTISREENAWANPPYLLLGRLLAKVIDEQLVITVLAPVWPSQPWWPVAISLLTDFPVLLPVQADFLLTVNPSGTPTPSCPAWRSAALRLSGASWRRAAFRSRLSTLCSNATRAANLAALSAATAEHGMLGALECVDSEAIHSISRSLMSLA